MPKEKLVGIKNNVITKIINKELVFRDRDFAESYLAKFKEQNKTFPKYSTEDGDAFVVWIYDYELTQLEITKGYAGNFALIFIEEDSNQFIVTIKKIPIQLKEHPTNRKPKFISKHNPKIEKIATSKLKFENIDNAREYLKGLAKGHILSEKHNGLGDDGIVMWIKGFQVTKEEAREGLLGNYAKIFITEEGGYYYVSLEKLFIKEHPQRKRGLKAHPDMGNPKIRNLDKNKYDTFDQAKEVLDEIAQTYPKAVRNQGDRLFVNIFSKTFGSPPIRSHVLDIILHNGKYQITIKENVKSPTLHNKKIDEFCFSTFYLDFFSKK